MCGRTSPDYQRGRRPTGAEKRNDVRDLWIPLHVFGKPPKSFDFEYVDKDKKYHVIRGLTPRTFYQEYVGLNLREDYVSIINSPTKDKPFGKSYTVDYLGNVAEGAPVRYYNIPMDTLKELIIRQLSDGEIVWFGSDVGKYGERDMGLGAQTAMTLRVHTASFDMEKEKAWTTGRVP